MRGQMPEPQWDIYAEQALNRGLCPPCNVSSLWLKQGQGCGHVTMGDCKGLGPPQHSLFLHIPRDREASWTNLSLFCRVQAGLTCLLLLPLPLRCLETRSPVWMWLPPGWQGTYSWEESQQLRNSRASTCPQSYLLTLTAPLQHSGCTQGTLILPCPSLAPGLCSHCSLCLV
jgi:hypothetical protein